MSVNALTQDNIRASPRIHAKCASMGAARARVFAASYPSPAQLTASLIDRK
jgi:hypothetical protein